MSNSQSSDQRFRRIRRILQWHKGLIWPLIGALIIQLLITVFQTALPLALLAVVKVLPGDVSTSLFWQLVGIASVDMAANWLGMASINLRETAIARILQRMRETYLVQSLLTGPLGRKPPASDMTSTLEKATVTDVYWIIKWILSFLVTTGGTLLLATNPWTVLADIVLGGIILQRSIQRGKKMGKLARYSREHHSVMNWIMQKMHTETVRTQIEMHPAIQNGWLAAFTSENHERFVIDRRSKNWAGFFTNLASTLQDLAYYLEFLIPVGLAYFQHTRVLFSPIALYTLARYSSVKITAMSTIGSFIVDLGSIAGEQQEIVDFIINNEEQEARKKAARASTQPTLPTAHNIGLENFSIAIRPREKKEETKTLVPTWDEWKKKKPKNAASVVPPAPRYLLQDVNLQIGTLGTGEICGVVAENGNGKTTLIKLLMSRLDTGDSAIQVTGHATIGGIDIEAIDKERYTGHCVAYCQQKFERSLGSVHENIVAGNDIDPATLEHVAALLRINNLSDTFELRQEDSLSGGERRKIAIAQVAVRKVLVAAFDEPSNDLDGLALEGLIKLLREMRDAGMLVLVISHDEHITQMFDSAVYLPGDGTARYGPIRDLARSPAFAKLAKVKPARSLLRRLAAFLFVR